MEEESNDLSDDYKKTALSNIKACRKALVRMKNGVQLIENNENALFVFKLMNRAIFSQHLRSKQEVREYKKDFDDQGLIKYGLMEDYIDIDLLNKKTWPKKIDYTPSWYPYQLAFILINLKSIVEPESEDRDNVECLWFPTGGGKTEAYLGLIAFTIFYRKILDPRSNGVIAVMRYTLRLLTAQQFQRASCLITACDRIRSEMEGKLGYEPLSIGLWVGGASSPNTLKDAFRNLDALNSKSETAENKFLINKCSHCSASLGPSKVFNSKTNKYENQLIGYRKKHFGRKQKIVYACDNKDCEYDYSRPLPIYVVDEDLYENKPSLIIGTVDKFARLPWDDRSINLFKHDIEKNIYSPDLIIQDELHLISGPLGSVVGVYESTIQEIFSKNINGKKVYPKIIASTATVTRATEQMNQLYNNRFESENFKNNFVNLFPHPVINAEDSFFGKEVIDPEKSRVYVGLNPTGYSDSKTAQVRIISSLMQASKSLGVEEEVNRDPYWTLLMYFNSLNELSGVSTLLDQDVKAALEMLKKRKFPDELEYIYNQDVTERKWDRKLRSKFFNDLELASRQTKDVQKALEALEVQYTGEETKKNPIDVCLATNMVSVGVDIDRLGSMLVVGQPKTTSEYIQATSRVGRKYPGVVFCLV